MFGNTIVSCCTYKSKVCHIDVLIDCIIFIIMIAFWVSLQFIGLSVAFAPTISVTSTSSSTTCLLYHWRKAIYIFCYVPFLFHNRTNHASMSWFCLLARERYSAYISQGVMWFPFLLCVLIRQGNGCPNCIVHLLQCEIMILSLLSGSHYFYVAVITLVS